MDGSRPAAWIGVAALAAAGLLWAVTVPEQGLLRESPALVAHVAFLMLVAAALFESGRVAFRDARRVLGLATAAGLLLLLALQAWMAEPACRAADDASPTVASSAQGSGPRHNVVLIVADTLRRDHLPSYGYARDTAPFLEEFSREAVVHTGAISVSPWSLPAHASIFTGLYPGEQGAHAPRDWLPDDAETLAERLLELGYRTGGVSANPHWVGRRVNLHQGFEHFCDTPNPRFPIGSSHFALHRHATELLRRHMPLRLARHTLRPYPAASEVSVRALDWVDSLPDDAPFFLFLNYMSMHQPFFPPREIVHRWPGYDPALARIPLLTQPHMHGRQLSEEEREHYVSQYDASLLYLDAQLRTLVEGLEERGVLDNSLVIFTSDHGEAFGEHGMVGHTNSLYREALDIPLIIRYPGGEPRGRDDRILENRVLFDRVLAHADGSRAPADDASWSLYAERYHPSFQEPWMRSVAFDRFKFIADNEGAEQLYDLEADPAETSSLAASAPEDARRGRELLDHITARTKPADPGAGAAEPASPGDIERLRALGYVY
jgi:hypothetical protein